MEELLIKTKKDEVDKQIGIVMFEHLCSKCVKRESLQSIATVS